MKKYGVLFFFTLFLVSSIIFVGNYFISSIKDVKTISITPTNAENFIVCSGKIEYTTPKDIYVTEPMVAKEFCVNIGDYIKKGDIIAYLGNVDGVNVPSLPGGDNNLDNIDTNLKEVYFAFLKGNISNKKDISCTKISDLKSPFTGWVSSINTKKNSVTDSLTPIVTISENNEFQTRICVNESHISDIKVGQKVIVSCVGIRDKKYQGTVREISNEARQLISATGPETVVDVVIVIDPEDDDFDIKPGFTANCKIITDEMQDILILPYDVVQADENGNEYVYKYNNGQAIKNYITTGKEFESGFEVLSGIETYDKIILSPENIKDKCKVKLIT